MPADPDGTKPDTPQEPRDTDRRNENAKNPEGVPQKRELR